MPRFAKIAADNSGGMVSEELAKQVVKDGALSDENNENHQISLHANIVTTFAAGHDEFWALRQSLSAIGSDVSYVHVDRALDFGFGSNPITLASPDTMTKSGLPAVQESLRVATRRSESLHQKMSSVTAQGPNVGEI